MSLRRLVPLFALCFMFAACDSVDTNDVVEEEQGEGGTTLPRSGQATVDVNDFQIKVDTLGALHEGMLRGASGDIHGVYAAGLWVAAMQEGVPRGNITWVGTYPESNFTSRLTRGRAGVYYLTPDRLDQNISNWPDSLGAPVDAQGEPLLYGDAMAWSALESAPAMDQNVLAQPLRDIRVSQAVFGYDRDGLENALFVRYEIENRSSEALDEVYVGFHVDGDLADPGAGEASCASVSGNNVGYDVSTATSFTYDVRYRGDDSVAGCDVPVFAHTFLESPMGSSSGDAVSSHRMLWKNDHVDGDFGERDITTPEHVLLALQGLSATGEPMIDPVASAPSMYAFTGDPVQETGWLDYDNGRDVRSLLTAGPFRLEAGESDVLTVLLIMDRGPALSNALKGVEDQVVFVRSRTDLWQF